MKALEAKPGSVERVEFELEADGKASCEFDIKTADGDYRVEIDATAAKKSNHRRNCWKSAASDRPLLHLESRRITPAAFSFLVIRAIFASHRALAVA
ncbi:MAG: PepSY domain-containing protein [Nevskia sp.]|nr:PepSY domain-containing protein [Nevskia sp.]